MLAGIIAVLTLSNVAVSVADSSVLSISTTKQLIFPGTNPRVDVTRDDHGNFLVFGSVDSSANPCSGGKSEAVLYRYKSDGTLDASFGTNGTYRMSLGDETGFFRVFMTRSGSYIVSGSSQPLICSGNYDANYFTIKLNSLGVRDPNFASSGTLSGVYFSTINQDTLYSVNDSTITAFNSDGALLTSFGSNGSLTLSNSHIHYPLLLFQEKNIYAAGMLSGFPGSVIPVGFSSIKNGAETIIFQGNNSYAYTAGYKDTPVTQPIYIRGKIYVAASVLDAIGPPNVRNPVILSFNENGGLNKDFGTNGSYRNLVPNTGQLYGSMVFTKFKDNQILFASYDGISLVFQSFNLQQKATEPAKLIGSIPYTALNQVMQVGANLFMAHGEAQGLDSSKSVMTVSLISIN